MQFFRVFTISTHAVTHTLSTYAYSKRQRCARVSSANNHDHIQQALHCRLL